MRLIDADVVLDLVKPIVDDDAFRACTIETTKMIIFKLINDAPTVDAVPVKHGYWIEIGSQDSIRNMKCSICGEEVFGDVDTEKYCFNCGAKMDEETE